LFCSIFSKKFKLITLFNNILSPLSVYSKTETVKEITVEKAPGTAFQFQINLFFITG